jgi:hypothetical protein
MGCAKLQPLASARFSQRSLCHRVPQAISVSQTGNLVRLGGTVIPAAKAEGHKYSTPFVPPPRRFGTVSVLLAG